MNRRAQILAALAVVGLVAVFLVLRGGGGSDVSQPAHRTAGSAPAGSARPAGSPAPTVASGYDAYRLFHTRNVFDPDRRPLRPVSNEPAATPTPAHSDFVALTGTMFDAGRSLAFFSGSRAEYNKVLSLRDRIAGAEITQITPVSIEITRDGRPTVVAVGQTVPLASGGVPGAAPGADSFATAPSTVAGTPAGTGQVASASPGPVSSGKQDEIRRRLEERRRQEQK